MGWEQRIRDYRGERSLRDVARQAGLTDKTVAKLETGEGTMDSLVQLMELGLGRDVAELFLA